LLDQAPLKVGTLRLGLIGMHLIAKPNDAGRRIDDSNLRLSGETIKVFRSISV
jgi:hypothetical protein